MTEKDLRFSSLEGTRRKILIADPDPENRAFLTSALKEQYDIAYADTAKASGDTILSEKDSPALVLLNLALPDFQNTLDIKHIVEDLHIPIIAMSSDRNQETQSLKLGAMDFILLPCPTPETVLARVSHAIELWDNRSIFRYVKRDPLTGLYNKDFFFSYVEQYDAYHKGLSMDAIVVNINHFHMINERYGRSYGDDVLRSLGKKLDEYIAPEGGILCRREGDVFMIYCPHRTD